MPVPNQLVGVWNRNYIQRGEGAEKEEGVRVTYLQTPSLFVDVRIPGEGAKASDLLAFAGAAQWEEKTSVLTWHAAFNLDPPEDDPEKVWAEIHAGTHKSEDFGKVEFVNDHKWMEYGDGYTEEWVQVATDGPTGHLSAVKPQHIFVVVNGLFGYCSTATSPHTYCIGDCSTWTVVYSATKAVIPGASLNLGPSADWTVSPDSTLLFPPDKVR